MPRPGCFILRKKNPVPIVLEAGCAPGPVWIGAENLDLTGIRSPDVFKFKILNIGEVVLLIEVLIQKYKD
jgi:hypothetical protein